MWRSMRRRSSAGSLAACLGALALAGGVTVAAAGAADAAPGGPSYFSAAGFNCAIAENGNVGCDLGRSVPLQQYLGIGNASIYIPRGVRQMVIDNPWTPARPGLGIGTPFTRSGGNPPIETVGVPTGSGATAGYKVSRGGSSCYTGFHGAFYCTGPGGHGFNYYIMITAS
ncbi:hypothetical protein [Gordonia pseudamarae]|jgi:hypothetical protein|nr:hypothetical protein [Gordonia pseudamarae]